jgi:hypothetical protein
LGIYAVVCAVLCVLSVLGLAEGLRFLLGHNMRSLRRLFGDLRGSLRPRIIIRTMRSCLRLLAGYLRLLRYRLCVAFRALASLLLGRRLRLPDDNPRVPEWVPPPAPSTDIKPRTSGAEKRRRLRKRRSRCTQDQSIG